MYSCIAEPGDLDAEFIFGDAASCGWEASGAACGIGSDCSVEVVLETIPVKFL